MIRIRAMKISEQLIKPERKTSINPIYDFNGCMKLMIGALITPIVSTQKTNNKTIYNTTMFL